MALAVKNPTANAGSVKRHRFDPWVGQIPWRRARQTNPVCLPGEFLGQRSLADYSPSGRKESDATEATEHANISTQRHYTEARASEFYLLLTDTLTSPRSESEELLKRSQL